MGAKKTGRDRAVEGPTKAQRAVLQEMASSANKGCPTHYLEGSGRQQMGRRMEAAGWGRMNFAGIFEINAAGLTAAKEGV